MPGSEDASRFRTLLAAQHPSVSVEANMLGTMAWTQSRLELARLRTGAPSTVLSLLLLGSAVPALSNGRHVCVCVCVISAICITPHTYAV